MHVSGSHATGCLTSPPTLKLIAQNRGSADINGTTYGITQTVLKGRKATKAVLVGNVELFASRDILFGAGEDTLFVTQEVVWLAPSVRAESEPHVHHGGCRISKARQEYMQSRTVPELTRTDF